MDKTLKMKQINNCPNCNSNNIKDFITTCDKHYGVIGNFSTSKCQNCSLVFMNPMPNNEELSKFYPEDTYYSFKMDISKKENKIKNFLLKIFCVNFPLNEPKFNLIGSILDVGCGNGYRLLDYKNKGWNVHGVEPSENASKIGNENNLNIHCGTLNDANYETSIFNYVFSNHSFEHINNPNEFLIECSRVMKPNGKLFIGVPNINGIVSKIFKSNWYYFGLPVHTFNYNEKTLVQILEKHNFQIEKICYNSTWGGILGSFQIVINKLFFNKHSSYGFFVKFIPFKPLAGFFAKIFNYFRIGDCIEIIAVKK